MELSSPVAHWRCVKVTGDTTKLVATAEMQVSSDGFMDRLLYIIKYALRSYSSSAVGKLEYSYAILLIGIFLLGCITVCKFY